LGIGGGGVGALCERSLVSFAWCSSYKSMKLTNA